MLINNLVKEHNISKEILALKVGIRQTKIHEIISGKTQKIDVLFMQKNCKEFEVSFDYFLNDTIINNMKKVETCNIGCNTGNINNSIPEGSL